jgi:hypothetical protein
MVAGVGAQYVVYKLQSPCNSQGKRIHDHGAWGRAIGGVGLEMQDMLYGPRQGAIRWFL